MNQLGLIALYGDSTKKYKKIFELIQESQCTLIKLELRPLHPNITCIEAVLKGDWNQLTRFETRFFTIKQEFIFSTIEQISHTSQPVDPAIPYNIYISMPNLAQNVHKLMIFASALNMPLHELSLKSYDAPLTRVSMLEVNLTILLPFTQSISTFREDLLHFCDENNFEISLEQKRYGQ